MNERVILPLSADSRAIIELWWSVASRHSGNAQAALTGLACLHPIDHIDGDPIVRVTLDELSLITKIHYSALSTAIHRLIELGIVSHVGRTRDGLSYRLHRGIEHLALDASVT